MPPETNFKLPCRQAQPYKIILGQTSLIESGRFSHIRGTTLMTDFVGAKVQVGGALHSVMQADREQYILSLFCHLCTARSGFYGCSTSDFPTAYSSSSNQYNKSFWEANYSVMEINCLTEALVLEKTSSSDTVVLYLVLPPEVTIGHIQALHESINTHQSEVRTYKSALLVLLIHCRLEHAV